jgi:hypothetical protein
VNELDTHCIKEGDLVKVIPGKFNCPYQDNNISNNHSKWQKPLALSFTSSI